MFAPEPRGKPQPVLGMQSQLSVIDQERDLGVLEEDSLLKVLTQCAAVVKKHANSMLGLIKRGAENNRAGYFSIFIYLLFFN